VKRWKDFMSQQTGHVGRPWQQLLLTLFCSLRRLALDEPWPRRPTSVTSGLRRGRAAAADLTSLEDDEEGGGQPLFPGPRKNNQGETDLP